MMPTVVILIYSCLASTPMQEWNPHMLHATEAFVAKHPGSCSTEVIERADVTIEQCQQKGWGEAMTAWVQQNPDRVYLGAPCATQDEPIEYHALEDGGR